MVSLKYTKGNYYVFYFSELKKKKEEYEKKKNICIKIQHIGWDSNLKDNTYWSQRLEPLGHADSQRNESDYDIITLNMLKEKSFSRQSLESILVVVNCQLLVDSYEMEIDLAEN